MPEATRLKGLLSSPSMGLLDVREEGVFAGQDWPSLLEVMALTGRLLPAQEVALTDTHLLQVSERTYLDMTGEDGAKISHSCAPSCGVMLLPDRMILVALRPLHQGERITIDYATTSTDTHYTWSEACGCGAPTCRKRVSGFPTLSPTRQAHYIRLGVVPAYVIERILPAWMNP